MFRCGRAAFPPPAIPAPARDRVLPQPVYAGMGYIITLVVLLLIVPLVFMMLSRRTTSAGGVAARHRDRGVTVEQPSSDAPEPNSDSGVNQPKPGMERRLPPG